MGKENTLHISISGKGIRPLHNLPFNYPTTNTLQNRLRTGVANKNYVSSVVGESRRQRSRHFIPSIIDESTQ